MQPINFISLSNSALYCPKALSTPACPAAAKAYKYNLPPEQAFAPKDKALSMWVPLWIPPSQITSNLSPTASTISDPLSMVG